MCGLENPWNMQVTSLKRPIVDHYEKLAAIIDG
jgi:hypothetical protein